MPLRIGEADSQPENDPGKAAMNLETFRFDTVKWTQ